MEMDFRTNEERDVLSSLAIHPNSTLKSDPTCAYLINVNMDEVNAHHFTVAPVAPTLIETVQIKVIDIDWRSPAFFTQLAKEIGCQCKAT